MLWPLSALGHYVHNFHTLYTWCHKTQCHDLYKHSEHLLQVLGHFNSLNWWNGLMIYFTRQVVIRKQNIIDGDAYQQFYARQILLCCKWNYRYTIAIRANQRAYLVEKMIEENKEKVEASVTWKRVSGHPPAYRLEGLLLWPLSSLLIFVLRMLSAISNIDVSIPYVQEVFKLYRKC